MKKAENQKYLIINTENRYYLYPYYIFDKISGEVITANKSDIEKYIINPSNNIEENIGLLCKERRII